MDASLDAPLSRWLWIVKWVLVIPHYIVLAFLWLAFIVLSAVAWVIILATGRYPRGIFEFNVGVLRWTWRVQYYSIGAFGTDRYPPFSLADDPSYPARLQVDYPGQLSRGLALVKWWLLAIPQYIVIAVFTGGGLWLSWQPIGLGGLGLIGILAIIAATVLTVTGRYPVQIFDFVLGMDRWVLRVVAYAALMTDRYPPFRLDSGGHDPGFPTFQPGLPAHRQLVSGVADGRHGWTSGRIVSVTAGAMLVLVSLGLLGGGGTALWAQTQKHGGYVGLGGTTRIQVTPARGSGPAFAGIAPAAAAERYLAGVAYTTVGYRGDNAEHAGSAPAADPAVERIWTAQATGPGTQTLTWAAHHGIPLIFVPLRRAS